MDHRVLKTDAAGSTRYLIDPFGDDGLSRVLRETNASGSVDYVYAAGTLLSTRRGTRDIVLPAGRTALNPAAD